MLWVAAWGVRCVQVVVEAGLELNSGSGRGLGCGATCGGAAVEHVAAGGVPGVVCSIASRVLCILGGVVLGGVERCTGADEEDLPGQGGCTWARCAAGGNRSGDQGRA